MASTRERARAVDGVVRGPAGDGGAGMAVGAEGAGSSARRRPMAKKRTAMSGGEEGRPEHGDDPPPGGRRETDLARPAVSLGRRRRRDGGRHGSGPRRDRRRRPLEHPLESRPPSEARTPLVTTALSLTRVSSAISASALSGRFSGSLESTRMTSASTSGGTRASGATSLSERGGVLMCRAMTTMASSSVNGGRPGEHVIEDDAQRVEVAARVERLALRLLGRHVPRRPEHRARLRLHGVHRELAVGVQHLGDAEVEDLDDLLVPLVGVDAREEEVVGLEVAVDDPLGVRLGERAQRLPRRLDGLLDPDAPDALDALAERLALEQLHREVEVAVLALAEVEHRDRVRRREQAVGARLAQEARAAHLVDGAVAAQDLDGDVAADGRLLGAVHRAHRAGAEAREDGEAPGEDAPEHRIAVGRGQVGHPDEGRAVVRAMGLGMPSSNRRWHCRTNEPLRGALGRRRVVGATGGGGVGQVLA